MGLLNRVERKSLKGRLWRFSIILILGLGGVTMVYPFLLMLASSITSNLDYAEFRLVPRYLTDDTVLFRKFLFERYGEKGLAEIKAKYHLGRMPIPARPGSPTREPAKMRTVETFEELAIDPTRSDLSRPGAERQLADWQAFLNELPEWMTRPYYLTQQIEGKTQEGFQDFLSEHFGGSIDRFNADVDAILPYPDFTAVDVPANTPTWHTWFPEDTPLKRLWKQYKKALPYTHINPVGMDEHYQRFLEGHYETLAKLNAAWGAHHETFAEIRLPVRAPEHPEKRKAWDRFVRLQFPWFYTRVAGDYTEAWRTFLLNKYNSEALYNKLVDRVNKQHGNGSVPYLAQTVFTADPPPAEFSFQHWGAFIDAHVPPEHKTLLTVQSKWHAFLQERYASVAEVNAAYGASCDDFAQVDPPWLLLDLTEFKRTRGHWVGYFLTHNYQRVLSFIATKGRALWNTIVLIVLTVVGTLAVQASAAFALSRFKLSYSYKIMLFLLATMAFPAEVSMIPSFLMLREFGFLNTFAALVWPGLVGGIGVLWLKGYFDSLPQELFDQALIDGASEFRIFWHIILPIAKPVLAVIALGSFTAAYTGFMWAFVVCQDERMWTLMVWLYEFQAKGTTTESAQMAAFVIAALPTLLVFIFCQKIIMRGIVVPTMK